MKPHDIPSPKIVVLTAPELADLLERAAAKGAALALAQTQPNPLDGYPERLRYEHLEALGFGSRSTIMRKWKAGELPAPDRDGEDKTGRPYWSKSDIQKFV